MLVHTFPWHPHINRHFICNQASQELKLVISVHSLSVVMDSKMALPADDSNSSRLSNSVAIAIAETETNASTVVMNKPNRRGCLRTLSRVIGVVTDNKKLLHAGKVGLALVLVSLLYMLEVIHDRLGDNAMWAVMTVVVVFEFTSGATISKGINRFIGTILGGGLGYLVALLAQQISGAGRVVAIGISLFIFGAAGTYTRMVPGVKKKYDYGVLIFILTFSLVAVSGVREDEIIKIASDRLWSICVGFAICLFISLFVFPVWAGNELHDSMAAKFDKLASSIEGCLEEHSNRNMDENMEKRTTDSFAGCLSVLTSKTTDGTLANFARWEPWHGRFGLNHPWNKYLQIGELLRQLATFVISFEVCLQSEKKVSAKYVVIAGINEHYETTCSLLAYTMRELGDRIYKMARYDQEGEAEAVTSKLRTLRSELCSQMPLSNGGETPSSLYVLAEIVDKVEEIVREVDKFGKTAGYTRK
ncbi:aluminum-activated malate transporter 10-like isoform X1 [Iris pallida]|uniref:Aluminum-activated malate transporter 10-like isoform X1 n=1 Tax=Iris pallida TaxID=29817 RepID=A0AAX6I1C7_IRIPA|nr:aluminum-activated malate transporter 10-like isoform X1 [Iris pallida]